MICGGSRGVGSNSTRRELQLIHTNTCELTYKDGLSKEDLWDLPGDPVVKTLRSQHRGCSSAAGWGTKSPPATLYDHPPPVKKKKRAPIIKKNICQKPHFQEHNFQTLTLLPAFDNSLLWRPFLSIVGCLMWLRLAPTP